MSTCICFVTNALYFHKFVFTCHNVITIGNYKNDICLIIGDDLKNSNIYEHPFVKQNKIIIKYFPNLHFDNAFLELQKKLNRPPHWYEKIFQYHKLYLFDVYFKKWNYIFYIDCGMNIYTDINPIINLKQPNVLLANRDGIDGEEWDEYQKRTVNKLIGNGVGQSMKLYSQFVNCEPYYSKLKERYNLYNNCFQTTCMLYDTSIIEENTLNNLSDLLFKYPISRTNDQGIITLYFTQIKSCWKQLPRKINNIYTYDLVRCVKDNYMMVKYPNSDTCEILNNGYFALYTGQIQ